MLPTGLQLLSTSNDVTCLDQILRCPPTHLQIMWENSRASMEGLGWCSGLCILSHGPHLAQEWSHLSNCVLYKGYTTAAVQSIQGLHLPLKWPLPRPFTGCVVVCPLSQTLSISSFGFAWLFFRYSANHFYGIVTCVNKTDVGQALSEWIISPTPVPGAFLNW